MKPLSDQNHYEILETHPSAARDEIERAYRLALATYDDDSLAGYSVFAEGDAAALRERIEAAYRVLSDNRMRSEYDETLVVDPDEDLPPAEPSAPLVPAETMTSEGPLRLRAGGMLHVDDGEGDFDGERLRHFRIRSGLEIEDIARVTKISPTYLRFIEEECFADLPDSVYVRGFVTAYANCVGLEGKDVAASYMKRFDNGEGERRRGRFFESR
ncbi:MAG: helix-turn-helix domain-containing protein [Deltaproteobacteria bacterium]|nr:helix-turn-helix domain-containing protein [Deltaproteobacteria bacterium]